MEVDFRQPMHVLAGESALRALRAVRYRGLAVPVAQLTPQSQEAWLPEQGKAATPSPERRKPTAPSPEQAFPSDFRTLADEGLPFQDIEANMRLELWQLGDVGPFTPERPLELAVFDRAHRTRGKKYRTRELPQALPADALVRVNANLYFVCPELIVAQMAPSLSAIQLAKLIMELCGSYSLSPAADQRNKTKYQLEPVTSLERIKRYSNLTKVRGGAKTLREALSYALEGSASPSETVLALMMSLPQELDGYGFVKPALNASLTVPDEHIGRVGGLKYSLDAFWQDAFTDLEYESVEFHLDPLAAASLVAAKDGERDSDPFVEMRRREYIAKADADRRRLRDLQFLGIHVIPVTSFDLSNVRRFDQVAHALAKNIEGPGTKGFDDWAADLDEGSYRERRRRLLQSLNGDAS